MYPQISVWPDQLDRNDLIKFKELPSDQRAAALFRLGEVGPAEALIISHLAESSQSQQLAPLALLAWMRLENRDLSGFKYVFRKLQLTWPDEPEVRALLFKLLLLKGRARFISSSPSDWVSLSDPQQCQIFLLLHVEWLIANGRIPEARSWLDQSLQDDSLEASILAARCEKQEGNLLVALSGFMSLLERAPSCLQLWLYAVETALDAKHSDAILSLARQALDRFGETPRLLQHLTPIKTLQRQPGLARRSALLNQLWGTTLCLPSLRAGNQLNTYEHNGDAQWLEYLKPSVLRNPLSAQQEYSNYMLQLASIESSLYGNVNQRYIAALRQAADFQRCCNAGVVRSHLNPPSQKSLRIGWITGDMSPHPVSRFLLGFFHALNEGTSSHQHHLISVLDYGPQSCADWFENFESVELTDISSLPIQAKVSAVRDLDFDLAIDLSGWTSGHFLGGFLARVAPVQCSYLGFFASTGIQEIDYWLGDWSLFPANYDSWHTETLWRLDRPFLAWQPVDPLPEATAEVTSAPSGQIRFGSFNHNRKLSDKTLWLWGQILKSVPDSTLVLKANASSDLATQQLLRRRMQRVGLDPERITWIPLTSGHSEHLQQYQQVDIALDPLPNGGCTTSCEALWMGAPVITKAGSSYVSRMSTAVLSGCGLQDWVAPDEKSYVQLAVEQAANLSQLRSSRDRWRQQIQLSPLGDASDLMKHLERAFTDMVQATINKS